ncbi:hypothetical protein Vse01_45500 [Micromonospora sediminimaris]|uniref:Uncharacterized protein n=1 Tax=Micromonospora sediminimaris TaxID=547162 RepID=A0A9W5XLT4_9ACTN|nr:hypothetical protein Vse01_45500 [Micromonospora sediminimaris]
MHVHLAAVGAHLVGARAARRCGSHDVHSVAGLELSDANEEKPFAAATRALLDESMVRAGSRPAAPAGN